MFFFIDFDKLPKWALVGYSLFILGLMALAIASLSHEGRL